MATITPGKYYIVSALAIKSDNTDIQSSGNLALHLYWGWTANGTNVNLATLEYKDPELWEVSSLGGDIMRITSCLAGRCLDITGANLTSGTNVEIWDANDSNAQKWLAVSANASTTIDHVSYPLYYIKSAIDQNLALDVEGASNISSANVEIYTFNQQDNQKWAFVPYQLFHGEGVYEVRSMLNTSLCMDVPNSSKNAETQIQLYTVNHDDNQKWKFEDMINVSGSLPGWKLTNVASGLALDFYNETYANGTKVQQYPANGNNSQRWLLIDHGTTVVEGYDCKMVSFGAGNKEDYVIDAPGSNASSGNALQLWVSQGTDNQLWALYPTKKSADSLVVPSNTGVSTDIASAGVSGGKVYWDGVSSSLIYPSWSCPDSWLSGQNHFQIRYRKRFHSPIDSSWTDWEGETSSTDITPWKDITVSVSDGTAYLADGIDMAFNYSGTDTSNIFDEAELYFEVRCVVQSSEELLYGNATSGTGYLCYLPTISLNSAEININGLTLYASSTYQYGPTNIYFDQITQTINGKDSQILKSTHADGGESYTIYNGSGSFTVPRSQLGTLSPEGVLKIHYKTGTPCTSKAQFVSNSFYKWTNTVSIGLGPGNYVPTISLTTGSKEKRTLVATIGHIGTERLFIHTDNDTRYEIAKDLDGNFQVPYPFGRSFVLEALCYNSDVSKWGTTLLNVPETNSLVSQYTPCHAFSVIDSDGLIGDTLLCLELRLSESPETNGSVSMEYEAYALAGREYQTVSFSSAKKKSWSVVGVLLNKFPISYVETEDWNRHTPDVLSDELKHCIYRAPNGEEYTAAITGISYVAHPDVVTLITGEQYKGYNEITVNLIRESY